MMEWIVWLFYVGIAFYIGYTVGYTRADIAAMKRDTERENQDFERIKSMYGK